jgi:hypothetical protein
MNSRATILSLVALLMIGLQRSGPSYASATPTQHQPCLGLTSDLRSAHLQRAGVVRYDESNRTPEGLRQQLHRHFDVVLSLLRLATPDSIELAVARLEAADDHLWTAQERTAWRHKLRAARHLQLQRLAAYRDRGIFPLNEGQSANAVPIFVDRHGTACAVGHLMRCAGWNDAVDSIAKSNNLVYVPDAPHSAIAAWVLTSGLTLEEAALIQPGYHWGGAEFDASAYEPGELTFEKEGLVFSKFRLQAQNYNPPNVPVSTGAKPTLAGLGLLAGKGTYYNGNFPPPTFPLHVPMGTHWIAIAVSSLVPPLHSLNASADVGRGQMVTVSFDVAVTDTNQRINGISESSYSYWQGFQSLSGNNPPASAIYYLRTTALDGATPLATLNIDQSNAPGFFTRESDTESFAPRQQITVEARLWLQDGVQMNTYVLDFNVVPEPASGFLGAVLMASYGLKRTRERVANTSE